VDHACGGKFVERRRRCRDGECQVPEGPGKIPEVSRINNRRPKLDGDLGLHVHLR
jgi:hypothetical protein